ncbi:hypothetical protein G6L37_35030 [Agrobacterium rubi]|nr:hypothetical protein [Agrobacterium rubi]NTF23784.1 hypothetical protein [Agrobacterium rubi]
MSDQIIKQQYDRWTGEHAQAAQKQGWDMFDYDCRGLLQIQRCDMDEAFATDADAVEFVGIQAADGNPTAMLAVELNSFFDRHIYPADYETETDTETKTTLPAIVQPQIWVNDQATDSGNSIAFDAQSAMLALSARMFRHVSQQILNDLGHDYDDLALNSNVIDEWLADNREATFLVTVDEQDFHEWLEAVGLNAEDALSMTDEGLQELRDRVANGVEAPASAI